MHMLYHDDTLLCNVSVPGAFFEPLVLVILAKTSMY